MQVTSELDFFLFKINDKFTYSVIIIGQLMFKLKCRYFFFTYELK